MIVSLDVGGSSVKSGAVDAAQPVGEVVVTPVDHGASAEEILDRFVHAAAVLPATDRVALAIPEPFDYERGISLMTHKFAALRGVPVADELAARLGRRRDETPMVRCCNDAAAAVVGEAIAGAGVGYGRVLGLTLGTGLGAALVVGGRPIAESGGVVAGELWAEVLPDGGTADDLFSARGFMAALEQGDATPAEWGRRFGRFLRPVLDAVEADVVVLGGGGTMSFPDFGPALTAELDVPVVVARLDRWAPIVGAAAICFD